MTPPLGCMLMCSMGGIPGVRASATALPASRVARRVLASLASSLRSANPSRSLSMVARATRMSIRGGESGSCSRTCSRAQEKSGLSCAGSSLEARLAPCRVSWHGDSWLCLTGRGPEQQAWG